AAIDPTLMVVGCESSEVRLKAEASGSKPRALMPGTAPPGIELRRPGTELITPESGLAVTVLIRLDRAAGGLMLTRRTSRPALAMAEIDVPDSWIRGASVRVPSRPLTVFVAVGVRLPRSDVTVLVTPATSHDEPSRPVTLVRLIGRLPRMPVRGRVPVAVLSR